MTLRPEVEGLLDRLSQLPATRMIYETWNNPGAEFSGDGVFKATTQATNALLGKGTGKIGPTGGIREITWRVGGSLLVNPQSMVNPNPA